MKINFIIALLGFAVVALSGCGKITPATDKLPGADDVAMKLQQTDNLYVAEYVVHKIITAEDLNRVSGSVLGHDFSVNLAIGERKIAIPMDAHIKAYINFNSVSPTDIVVTDNPRTLTVTLPTPKAELTSSKIAHNEIKEFRGIFRSKFSDSEISELEKHGRNAILASIPDMGIINTAKANGREVLVPILAQAGFSPENIIINFKD